MSGLTRWPVVLLRRLFARRASVLPSDRELPIKPPRYSSRLTGESFERYDPRVQEQARHRRESMDEARRKAAKLASGAAAPLREARRA